MILLPHEWRYDLANALLRVRDDFGGGLDLSDVEIPAVRQRNRLVQQGIFFLKNLEEGNWQFGICVPGHTLSYIEYALRLSNLSNIGFEAADGEITIAFSNM